MGVELTIHDDGGTIKCCSLAFSDYASFLSGKHGEASDSTNLISADGWITRTASPGSDDSTRADPSEDLTEPDVPDSLCRSGGNEMSAGSWHDPGVDNLTACGLQANMASLTMNGQIQIRVPHIQDTVGLSIAVSCA